MGRCAYPYCDRDESWMHGFCSEGCLSKAASLLRDLKQWGDLPDQAPARGGG